MRTHARTHARAQILTSPAATTLAQTDSHVVHCSFWLLAHEFQLHLVPLKSSPALSCTSCRFRVHVLSLRAPSLILIHAQVLNTAQCHPHLLSARVPRGTRFRFRLCRCRDDVEHTHPLTRHRGRFCHRLTLERTVLVSDRAIWTRAHRRVHGDYWRVVATRRL